MATPHFQNYTYDSSDPARRHEWDILDMDLGIVNALRRTMLTDIPIPGFMGEGEDGTHGTHGTHGMHSMQGTHGASEDVTIDIHENNGPLHNEIMKQRIGMIPIHFSAAEVDAFREEANADDANADDANADDVEDHVVKDHTWRFELDVATGPSQKRNVTSHDIRVFKGTKDVTASHARRLFPVDVVTGDPILITRLRENERLAFTARPVKRTGRDHAGFSPVSLCSFHFIQDPRIASEVSGILEKERAYYKDSRGDPTHIHFAIESECALTPRYLVNKAFEILIAKVRNNLTLTPPRVVIRPVAATLMATPAVAGPGASGAPKAIESNANLGYEFVFANEDDTLGNLLQSIIFNETIRKETDVTYVGYYCPHPLDPSMVLRLCVKNMEAVGAGVGSEGGDAEGRVIEILKAQMQKILALLETLQAEWNDFAPLE
jgi:DNA-directed RNA polymerase subunit L